MLTFCTPDNVERQYKIHFGHFGDAPVNTYGYFYCDESKVPGSHKKDKNGKKSPSCDEPGVSTYTWDDPGKFWSAHYVVLCPQFFSSRMSSLLSAVEAADGDPVVQRYIDYWKPLRVRSLFHETYHWKNTVSVPRCRDKTYDPRVIINMARLQQEDSVINAESWALAALSIYLQQVFHLESPPTAIPKSSPVIGGADIREHYLDAPPDWWERPVDLDSKAFNPSMDDTVMLSSMGSLMDSGPFPSCINGLYEDMHQCVEICGGDGSTCKQSPTNATIVCSGCVQKPATPTCKTGSYKDMDTCDASCSGGSCFLNAGESGVQCEDCPSS